MRSPLVRLLLTSCLTTFLFSQIGNFHALLLFQDDEGLELVSEACRRLVHRAIALDGTCKSLHLISRTGFKLY
jgi:hypothetical protein